MVEFNADLSTRIVIALRWINYREISTFCVNDLKGLFLHAFLVAGCPFVSPDIM